MFWQFLTKVYDAQDGGCGLFIVAVLVICLAGLIMYRFFDLLEKLALRNVMKTQSKPAVQAKAEKTTLSNASSDATDERILR
jgi:hypothetical protein